MLEKNLQVNKFQIELSTQSANLLTKSNPGVTNLKFENELLTLEWHGSYLKTIQFNINENIEFKVKKVFVDNICIENWTYPHFISQTKKLFEINLDSFFIKYNKILITGIENSVNPIVMQTHLGFFTQSKMAEIENILVELS